MPIDAGIAPGVAGRIVLITGASSGVGREMALAFGRAGATVAAAARRLDRLAALVAEIQADGGKALAVHVDVEDESAIIRAFDEIEATLGHVDTVIANAGVAKGAKSIEFSAADLDWIMRVNVRGSYLTAREGARRMIGNGIGERAGRIIFIASIAAHTVLPGGAAYCASKAAVVMLAKSFAREWAKDGINVNAICPGFMLTELSEDWLNSAYGKRVIDRSPRGRLMAPDDLCGAAIYFASDAARATTGAVLTIDDGQTL